MWLVTLKYEILLAIRIELPADVCDRQRDNIRATLCNKFYLQYSHFIYMKKRNALCILIKLCGS